MLTNSQVLFSAGETHSDAQDPNHVHRLQGTNLWLLEHTLNGGAKVDLGEKEYHATRGHIFLYKPKIKQSYIWDGTNQAWHHQWIAFSMPREWDDILSWPEPSPGFFALNIKDEKLIDRFNRLFAEVEFVLRSSFPRKQYFATNIIEQILLWADTVNPNMHYMQLDTRIRETMNYINEHFAEPLTLSSLARMVHLSPSRFAHLFSEQLGQSPISYLEGKRIERAREKLVMTSQSISTIAYSVGFSSPSYFSKVLKKTLGMSPRELRQHSS